MEEKTTRHDMFRLPFSFCDASSLRLYFQGSHFLISSFIQNFRRDQNKKTEIKDFVLNCSHDLMLMIQTWF